ncbi:MAG: Hpt domain-containing protein, partial [Azoarcus sp.]|nr:Hpt domain-containing protein [Azoarcus sp.]
MTIDIGQFIQIFLEEATEHLAAMESGLLGIDLAEPDPEQLNAIFRAAHSIKGGAGTFGFGDMADFTHTLETLLDRVRRGELALDDERLDACLRAVDVLRELLDGHRSGAAVTVSGADALTAELALLGSPNSTPQPLRARPQVVPTGRQRYQITIDVPADAGIEATAMATLLDALAQFGTLDLGQRPADGGPEGSWSITLESDLARSEIGDFISYVLAPEWLRIEAHPCHAEPVSDDGYGFFDPVPETTETADEGFGFFDPLPAAAETADQGFGFFEPLPATDLPAQDEGFGFFEPLPVSALAGGDEGFGLFEPLPAPADTPDAGFGFFEPLPATVATDAQAYGFFEPLPAETAPASLLKPESAEPAPAVVERPAPTVLGRRATDNAAPPAAAGDTTSIRVGINKVDQLINLVGELVITQSMLLQSAATLDPVIHERLLGGLAQL